MRCDAASGCPACLMIRADEAPLPTLLPFITLSLESRTPMDALNACCITRGLVTADISVHSNIPLCEFKTSLSPLARALRRLSRRPTRTTGCRGSRLYTALRRVEIGPRVASSAGVASCDAARSSSDGMKLWISLSAMWLVLFALMPLMPRILFEKPLISRLHGSRASTNSRQSRWSAGSSNRKWPRCITSDSKLCGAYRSPGFEMPASAQNRCASDDSCCTPYFHAVSGLTSLHTSQECENEVPTFGGEQIAIRFCGCQNTVWLGAASRRSTWGS